MDTRKEKKNFNFLSILLLSHSRDFPHQPANVLLARRCVCRGVFSEPVRHLLYLFAGVQHDRGVERKGAWTYRAIFASKTPTPTQQQWQQRREQTWGFRAHGGDEGVFANTPSYTPTPTSTQNVPSYNSTAVGSSSAHHRNLLLLL